MAGINGEQLKIIDYDTRIYDFATHIRSALGIGDNQSLIGLHKSFQTGALVTRATDSRTAIHQRFYKNIGNTGFYDVYRRFVSGVVSQYVEGPLIVQKVPSFRAHLPGNKAVGEYHRDKDFGHQEAAINFWVPVTEAYGTNAVHVKEEASYSPRPVRVMRGQALVFDAVNLFHGNEINMTGETRVSFDFRVMPESEYVESQAKAINTGIQLALGGYYVHATEL